MHKSAWRDWSKSVSRILPQHVAGHAVQVGDVIRPPQLQGFEGAATNQQVAALGDTDQVERIADEVPPGSSR